MICSYDSDFTFVLLYLISALIMFLFLKFHTNVYNSVENVEITDLKEDCPICLDKLYKEKSVIISCNHIFHKDCLEKWLSRKEICPLCKKKVT